MNVQPFSRVPGRLKNLKHVFIGETPESAIPVEAEEVVFKNRRWMMKFSGVNDRTAALGCNGWYLFVAERDVQTPPRGAYFSHEIIGCVAEDDAGHRVGVIEDILSVGTNYLWSIRTDSGTSLVPANKEFIRRVDVKNRRVILRLIDGLIDGGTEE